MQLVGFPATFSSTWKLLESSLRELVGNALPLSTPPAFAAAPAQRSWRSAGAVSTVVLDIWSGVGALWHAARTVVMTIEADPQTAQCLILICLPVSMVLSPVFIELYVRP